MQKPIRRNENLVLLSKEHHFGLLFGWKIKQGLKNNTSYAILTDYILYFWKTALLPHFNLEEKFMLSELDETDPNRIRVELEHRQIEKKIKDILANKIPEHQSLEELASLINDHIRFEEREFFPYFETKKSDRLEQLGILLNQSHNDFEDNYLPEFWIKK